MQRREPLRQSVRIISEIRQVTFPMPGEPKVVVALSYQVDAGPPRTLFIDQDKLPDAVWRREHPEGPPPSADLMKRGDEARREAIRADLEKRRQAEGPRTLEI